MIPRRSKRLRYPLMSILAIKYWFFTLVTASVHKFDAPPSLHFVSKGPMQFITTEFRLNVIHNSPMRALRSFDGPEGDLETSEFFLKMI